MDEPILTINDATAAFIRENLQANTDDLLLRKTPQDVDLVLAVRQINGLRKAAKKIPAWKNFPGLLFPQRLPLEQCSSQQTALFKCKIAKGNTLLDMTGGFAVDTYFLSQHFRQIDYVEMNPALFKIARHNLQLLGCQNIHFHLGDSVDFLKQKKEKYDWIFIDPYRRDANKKNVFFIEDCTPDIAAIQDLLLEKSEQVLIKFSPMLDIGILKKTLKNIARVIIVAVKNECRELLVVLSKNTTSPTIETADIYPDKQVLFQTSFSTIQHSTVPFAKPAAYLYEPNKAILKAGIQDKVAAEFHFDKLEKHSHFYTSDKLSPDFPGRIFSVKNIFKPKQLGKFLPQKKANVIARNFPVKAPVIYQKYKIIPGGNLYLVATTLQQKEKVFILTERIDS